MPKPDPLASFVQRGIAAQKAADEAIADVELDLPTSQQDVVIEYEVECPSCGDVHGPSENSMAGAKIECACGITFKVVH
jgi:hypothetical protein